jgi:hypothetical protein
VYNLVKNFEFLIAMIIGILFGSEIVVTTIALALAHLREWTGRSSVCDNEACRLRGEFTMLVCIERTSAIPSEHHCIV